MTIFIFLLAAIGLFNVLCGALKLPPRMTSQRLRSVSGKSHFFDSLRQKMLLPIIGIVAPFIRLDEFKLRRMKNKLERAEMPFTPQEYYARSVVIAAAVFIAGGIMSAVMMSKMILVMAVLAGIVYYHFTDEVNDKLKAKDALIENELPKFIRAIVQGLKTEKDIIKLLETYGTIAEKGLQYDIEVLIMDLKSGNFENGMLEFDKRMGNVYVSRLTKALISINRGDNQEAALNHLINDMSVLSHETMQRELNKRPGRVRMMVIPIVIVGVFTLFYVIGVNLFTSLNGII